MFTNLQTRTAVVALLFAVALVVPALTSAHAQTGGFAALLDQQNNFGDSRRSVVFYDVDDMSSPLFAVFMGQKLPGDNRSPEALTSGPNGDVYVLATDRDGIQGTQINNAPTSVENNTEGDYDLLRINFKDVYADWVNNQAMAYTTYNYQPLTDPPGIPPPLDTGRGHPSGGNTNEVLLQGAVTKLGEVARQSSNDFSNGSFFDPVLEYVDDGRLLVIDAYREPLGSVASPLNPDVFSAALVAAREAQITQDRADNVPLSVAANDATVRVIDRVSTNPGVAVASPEIGAGGVDPGPIANGFLNEGGYNQGTTESWEATVLGQVLLDGAVGVGTRSEIRQIAYVEDTVSGTKGLFISERDGGSTRNVDDNGTPFDQTDDTIAINPANDEVGFWEIATFTGTAGNGLKDVKVGASITTALPLDDNPVASPGAGGGSVDSVYWDATRNKLVIIESGNADSGDISDQNSVVNGGNQVNFDLVANPGAASNLFFELDLEDNGEPLAGSDEPSVITYDIIDYDTAAGEIELANPTYTQLAPAAIDDDDDLSTDSRWSIFDEVNNDIYFFDQDAQNDFNRNIIGINSGGVGPNGFLHDWFKLDLDTGLTTAVGVNADLSNGLFDGGDAVEFFFIQAFLLGDANNDGTVTADDLIAVQQNFGNVGPPNDGSLLGDANDDGAVTADDLIAVQQNFGNTLGAAGGSAVPEPASLVILAVAALVSANRRRRTDSHGCNRGR